MSDALKYSFLETPISTQATFMTEEERLMHQEQPNKAQVGVLKGSSLCLTPADIACIHRKFYALWQNKNEKDKQDKALKKSTGHD